MSDSTAAPDAALAQNLDALRARIAVLESENAGLRAHNAALRTSDLRLRRLLESEIIGVLIGDSSGQITDINDSFARMIGRSRAELDELDWRVGTIGAHFDITDRKIAEAERARFAARLESSNRDLEAFAYAVSHDLKEPLRKIEAFGSRLESAEGERMAPQNRDYLSRMRRAARRMTGLIDGLLLYSRAAAETDNRQNVDLNEIAAGVLLDLELVIERTGARIEISELPRVDADPIQMRQLLQNLIGNALNYRRDDAAPVVTITGRVLDERCELQIADNGRGFAPAEANKIFEIFQRLPDQRGEQTTAGAGVGLTICRRIAREHGGDVVAFSAPGDGARFVVTLPKRRPETE